MSCQEENGIRYGHVTGVQTCALPIFNTQIGHRCQELPVWPAQYRLDALADQGKVNLAYLVLGQGLELGWVEWVVLDQIGRAWCRERGRSREGGRQYDQI